MIAFLIGALIGGFFASLIIGWIVERFAFRSLPPVPRATWTMAVAWLIISVLAGFGMADGGPFAWHAGLIYLPGTLISWALMLRRLRKSWSEDSGEVDTFA